MHSRATYTVLVLAGKELVQGDGVPSMPSIHTNVLLRLFQV